MLRSSSVSVAFDRPGGRRSGHVRAAVVAVLLASGAGDLHAQTEHSTSAVGRTVRYALPAGYCLPAGSEVERRLEAATQSALGPNVKLLAWSAPCSELEELRRGRRQFLDRWLQVQLLGSNGQFKAVPMSREAFLVSLTNAKPKVETEVLIERVNRVYAETGTTMNGVNADMVGRDGNAAYMVMSAELDAGGTRRPIRGIGAFTLINSVPLSLLAYEYRGATGKPLEAIQQELLRSVLTMN